MPAVLAALALAAALSAAPAPLDLEVDLRDAPRRVFHARLSVPARPGPLVLLYPKWIPGEHGPTGPVADLAGLRITARGEAVRWTRDPLDAWTFHLEVPPGADRVEVALDALSPAPSKAGFSAGAAATPALALLSWNHVVLYPRGAAVAALPVRARVLLPEGWRLATALPVASASGAETRFAPVSLETLVDSPVLAGEHLVEVPLGSPGGAPHLLDLAADSPEAAELRPELRAGLVRLAAEAQALFGARHYRGYRFLVTLSDAVAQFGLEHHESSDDRMPERALVDPEVWRLHASLLPHEMVHSWNGKHRRPAAMISRDLNTPIDTRLLWIYEGLTDYLGRVLAARSGLSGETGFRDELAALAQELADRPGRAWRPLLDTAAAAHVLYGARPDGEAWRRSVDFYPEGTLLWLEVDARIRSRTGGARSLDDFCRAFFGGQDGAPEVRGYRLEDVLAALGAVSPDDWRGFFETRVAQVRAETPVAGIEAAGWRLVRIATPSKLHEAREAALKVWDVQAALGFAVAAEDGAVADVVPGSPAARAGLAPGARVVAVNGRKVTRERLLDALRAAPGRGGRVELLAANADVFRTHLLEGVSPLAFAALERDPSRPDLLADIGAPRAQAPPAPAAR